MAALVMHRASTQPYCRCCGKPIRKTTVKHLFGCSPRYLQNYEWLKDHAERPETLADAQRLMNGRILKHTWGPDRAYVREVIEWDGETYDSPFFCKHECARAFGAMAAREYPHLITQAAADAARKRNR